MRHVPVLLKEVIESLQLKQGMNVIDCTVGDAGHAEKIVEAIGSNGKLLAIDADPESLLRAKQYLYDFQNRVMFVRDNFAHLKKIVETENFGLVHGILMDLGWSSPQFEERGRGFSFLKPDEPLDMRYGKNDQMSGIKASNLLQESTKNELEKIFHEYGEEDLSEEISEAIVVSRKEKKIEKVGELVEIILQVYRKKLRTEKEVPWVGGLHPATKVFQALRIAVNNELDVVEKAIPQAIDLLESGGRLAIITFHSLEDRIVKHLFKDAENKSITIITKKPIVCGDDEYKTNSPSRSAKLRVVEKI